MSKKIIMQDSVLATEYFFLFLCFLFFLSFFFFLASVKEEHSSQNNSNTFKTYNGEGISHQFLKKVKGNQPQITLIRASEFFFFKR